MIPTRKMTTNICFDIETIPQDADRLMAMAPDFQPDSRLKDPEKIKANIAEKQQKFIEEAALHWTTAIIPLIGVGSGIDIRPIAHEDERDTIRSFFEIAQDVLSNSGTICGHNILGFDFPMLINRARVLDVPVPQVIGKLYKGRWQWNEDIVDTLQVLTFGNKMDFAGNGVESVARACGFGNKLGNGKDFPDLWSKNREAAIAYCLQDVKIEIQIARMCGVDV